MIEGKRRWPIAALVFFGHVLLLLLLDDIVREEPRDSIDSRRSTLFFIRLPERVPRPPVGAPEKRSASPELRSPGPIPPSMPPEVPTVSTNRPPRIDWHLEASEAARNTIQAKQAADALKFSEASKAPPKKCVKPKAPEWRKGTPTYGIAGGLPFVRFHDDRCIFVLIFIGCGFGAKPQADSHLCDNMHNYPNDSSVPDLDECEESPQRR